MSDNLNIELILKRKKYPFIYNSTLIIIIIIFVIMYILFTYKYTTYLILNGTVKNNEIELYINVDDLKYLSSNNILSIDNNHYNYQITHIDNQIINEYKYVYIDIDNINYLENYVYKIKIEKENKILAAYLKGV